MANSTKWPRLDSQILACMPATPGEPTPSGTLISNVQARFGDRGPSRDTITRALERLEIDGLVGKDGVSKDRVWWRTEKRASSDLARRPPLELAIALFTLKRHAPHHLPSHVVDGLGDYFAGAEKVLKEGPNDPSLIDARAWATKTVRIDAGYPLMSPPIDDRILNAIRQALYSTQVLSIRYRNSRIDSETPATFDAVPLALVERGPVLYLVVSRQRRDGSFKQYQLRLDRFVDAVCTDIPGEPDPAFDLEAYVRQNQYFSFFPEAPIRIELRVREDGEIRNLFREQRLARDQEIVEEPGGFRLRATVIPSVELRNLLMECCARVEVLSPLALRREIADKLRQAALHYADAPESPQVGSASEVGHG